MWLLLGWLIADPDLVIRSDSSCPGAADVAAQIAPLLPPGVRVVAAPESNPMGADQALLSVEDGQR